MLLTLLRLLWAPQLPPSHTNALETHTAHVHVPCTGCCLLHPCFLQADSALVLLHCAGHAAPDAAVSQHKPRAALLLPVHVHRPRQVSLQQMACCSASSTAGCSTSSTVGIQRQQRSRLWQQRHSGLRHQQLACCSASGTTGCSASSTAGNQPCQSASIARRATPFPGCLL